jgi:hypothetical protein
MSPVIRARNHTAASNRPESGAPLTTTPCFLSCAPAPKAESPNNAHHGETVEIHYALHPGFGQNFRVVARYRNGSLRLRDSNGEHVTVPAWMTDRWICQKTSFSDYPICSVAALQRLKSELSIWLGHASAGISTDVAAPASNQEKRAAPSARSGRNRLAVAEAEKTTCTTSQGCSDES